MLLATSRSYNPTEAGTSVVWALPRSLATTGGIIRLFSLPAGTKMFQFPAFASSLKRITVLQTAGLSHSEIHGSMAICASPWLIAACHVLHRLSVPRHSPCALYSLTFVDAHFTASFPGKPENSSVSWRLLSKFDPLRWVRIWFGCCLLTAYCFHSFAVSYYKN